MVSRATVTAVVLCVLVCGALAGKDKMGKQGRATGSNAPAVKVQTPSFEAPSCEATRECSSEDDRGCYYEVWWTDAMGERVTETVDAAAGAYLFSDDDRVDSTLDNLEMVSRALRMAVLANEGSHIRALASSMVLECRGQGRYTSSREQGVVQGGLCNKYFSAAFTAISVQLAELATAGVESVAFNMPWGAKKIVKTTNSSRMDRLRTLLNAGGLMTIPMYAYKNGENVIGNLQQGTPVSTICGQEWCPVLVSQRGLVVEAGQGKGSPMVAAAFPERLSVGLVPDWDPSEVTELGSKEANEAVMLKYTHNKLSAPHQFIYDNEKTTDQDLFPRAVTKAGLRLKMTLPPPSTFGIAINGNLRACVSVGGADESLAGEDFIETQQVLCSYDTKCFPSEDSKRQAFFYVFGKRCDSAAVRTVYDAPDRLILDWLALNSLYLKTA